MKTVVFRTDSSVKIGSGHLMRCLTLANALKEKGFDVHFICRKLKGNLSSLVKNNGHNLHLLVKTSGDFFSQPNDTKHAPWLEVSWQNDLVDTQNILKKIKKKIDLVILDSYSLDYRWEISLRDKINKIMVIDDLADRIHNCDLLLDQNYFNNKEKRYYSKVPDHCIVLTGPKYLILRDEFREIHKKVNVRSGMIKKILVFFGGVDADNYTIHTIKALSNIFCDDIIVDVVVGAQNNKVYEIESVCLENGFNCHKTTNRMAELMSSSDLSIGAGGATTLERICMGLPSIIFSIAENQYESVKALSENGYVFFENNESLSIEKRITKILSNISDDEIKLMSKKCMKLVDCLGINRVTTIIEKIL